MAAAMAYAGPNFPGHRSYGLVIDGFGTSGEHFSIYDLSVRPPKLVRRVHGYSTSLGLWFQYATAFMGLKMHEDEYKLLGYEVHAPNIMGVSEYSRLQVDAIACAAEWVEEMDKSIYTSKYDPMYDINALGHVKTRVFSQLTAICQKYSITDPSCFTGRAVLANYVQKVLESVVLCTVSELKAMHLLVSGGVFYNVKLNKLLIDSIEGQFCAYPLAGDQGNALGLYAMDNPEFQIPNNLCWGIRELKDVGHVPGLIVTDEVTAYDLVRERLLEVGYVNLVRGAMEFGPRALCNTSTLAMPTLHSVDKINSANNRNTVMPMAPVMTMKMYQQLFERTSQVWRSSEHMICAMEYHEHPWPEMLGIAHEYQEPYRHHTGRPQVLNTSDVFMTKLLEDFGHPLINTSFNFHGQPIALGMDSIINNHVMQYRCDQSFTTVVIKNV